MKATRVLVVGRNGDVSELAHSAAQVAFPSGKVKAASNLKTVLSEDGQMGADLLVLLNPTKAEVTLALGSTDVYGVTFWPVVVLGKCSPVENAFIVPPEEWNAPLVARVFGFAVKHHQLLRENARFRGDFLTIGRRICHDLRTPLGGIVTTSDVLKEVLSVEDKPNATLMQAMFESTDELVKLIERLSFLTKASSHPPPHETVSMECIVATVLFRVEHRILGKGGAVIQPSSWPEVEGVASWLEEIWWNLMTNAIRHGKNPASIEIGWDSTDGEYRFWIRDDGEGVPADQQGKLFYPFHQLHDPNAAHGLGLSIVQRLVELQGGRCGYEARDSDWRFYFTLPGEPEGEDSKPVKKRPQPALSHP